jgi:uncharacterized protein YjbJ (UPF0337 family)
VLLTDRSNRQRTLGSWLISKSGGTMANKKIDKAKGRAKEAAGAVTGNRHLKNEGRADQAKSSAKNAVDKVADTLTGSRKH